MISFRVPRAVQVGLDRLRYGGMSSASQKSVKQLKTRIIVAKLSLESKF